MTVLGVLYDPTTKGMGDSAQALTYDAPKSKMDDLANCYSEECRDPEDIEE